MVEDPLCEELVDRGRGASLQDVDIDTRIEQELEAGPTGVATTGSALSARRTSAAVGRCGFKRRSDPDRSKLKIQVARRAALARHERSAEVVLQRYLGEGVLQDFCGRGRALAASIRCRGTRAPMALRPPASKPASLAAAITLACRVWNRT